MTRLVLAAALVGAAVATVPASAAATCPTGFYEKGLGLYSPLTGKELHYCWPTPPPSL
ncbi:MAG TPA: hypothetical protein VF519_00710 [Mycobacteriales bacterium]